MEIYGKKIIVKMKQFSCNSSDMQMSAPLLKFITIFSYLTKDLAPNPLKQEKDKGRYIYNNLQPSNSTVGFPHFTIFIKYSFDE